MVRDIDRRDVLKGIGTAGIASMAGCIHGGGGGGEIKMGILMGVTGGLEQLGPPIRDAAELVATQVNDADTDYEVDTQFEDTETKPTPGISGAEALINAGYPMICGALASDVSVPVAESQAIPNQIPMNSPASTAPDFTAFDADFTFRTAVPDSFQGQVMADISRNRLDAESAATLAQDDAYGRGLNGAFVENFEEAGGTITEEVIFSTGESSYTSQLTNALSDDPDMLMIVGFPEDGVQIFQDFYSDFDRADMPVLVSDGLRDSELPDNVGFDMTNVTGTIPLGEGPGLEFFQNLYQDTYDADPSEAAFVRQAYDAAATLVLAHAAAGESDGVAVRDQIRPVTDSGGEEITPENLVEGVELAGDGNEINYRGVSGEIEYGDSGDQKAVSYEYFGYTADGGIEQLDVIGL